MITPRNSEGGKQLPVSTPHGIYKRKYHLRAIFQSIVFVALIGGYHVYNDNKIQTRDLENNSNSMREPQQQHFKQPVAAGSFRDFERTLKIEESHRRLSMVERGETSMLENGYGGRSRRLQANETDGLTNSNSTQEEGNNSNIATSIHVEEFDEEDKHDICEESEVAEPGWMVLFYSIGVLYMFLAIAIVCDEFFVEALEEISSPRHWNLDKDVAGATLMAAGGSAPELFTNLFGTFDESEIGFGTIIGSAAFNVLLVIAACSLAALDILDLTWWPLFRDTSYYAVNLIVLALFVGVSSPDAIEPWEAVILFLLYIGYVLIMWKNRAFYKRLTGKELVLEDFDEDTSDESGDIEAVKEKFDKLQDEKQAGLDEEQIRQFISSISSEIESYNVDGAITEIRQNQESEFTTWEDFAEWYRNSDLFRRAKDDDEDENEPLWAALKWEEDAGPWGKIWHTIQLPILACLVFTIPDVRRPGVGKWCYLAFFVSILWIGFFAWWMVKWSEIIGTTIGVPHVVMGYTVLAAGTSVPDLLSSVIVTRQGHGDMAISSSIGSNIFDITVGLPIPWLIYLAVPSSPATIYIDSSNIWISIFIFLAMLVLVVLTIHLQGWKLTKTLGAVMITFYFVFLAQAIVLELPFEACV